MPLTDHLLALALAAHPIGGHPPLTLNADALAQPPGGAQLILTVGAGMTKHSAAPVQTDARLPCKLPATGKTAPTAKAMKCAPKAAAAKHQG